MSRPKGSVNKRSDDAKQLSEDLGIDPLEILLYFAKGDWASLGYDGPYKVYTTDEGIEVKVERISSQDRQKAAADACPYIYPRRKAVEVKDQRVEEQLERLIINLNEPKN